MAGRETSYLGSITLRILHDMPLQDAGWLIRALAEWILDDRLPDENEIPESCLGAWIAIREESIAISEARKQSIEDKRKAALTRWNADGCRPMQKDADECKTMQRHASRVRAVELEKDVDNTDVVDVARTRASADGDLRSAGSIDHLSANGGDDGVKRTSYEAWAKLQPDPVDVALDITGEGPEKRRVYGARLRKLGRDRFLETVCAFRAEVAAGEPVRNAGAALTKRLNDAADAKAAMEAIA